MVNWIFVICSLLVLILIEARNLDINNSNVRSLLCISFYLFIISVIFSLKLFFTRRLHQENENQMLITRYFKMNQEKK